MFRSYHVYILASKKNGTLYIGFTANIEERIRAHKLKLVEGFTEKYNVINLVYIEEHETSYDAFVRERQLKVWKRNWKIELIEKDNPEWNDLAENWDL